MILIFGKELSTSVFKTSEKISKSKYVLYKFNTYSSLAYLFTSIYMFLNVESLFIITYIGCIISLLLTFASFFWWASQRKKNSKS